jgi:ribosomal protein S18 acetylase RimI-like enzyme
MSVTKARTNLLDTQTSGQVNLADAPAIPGLTYRYFQGPEDYPAMLLVNNGSKIADGMEYDLHTLETLRGVYENSSNHDLYQDQLLAEVDGQLVAYNRIFWDTELDGTRVSYHVGFVLPEWRGRGLGRSLIGWAEARSRRVYAAAGGAAPTALSADVNNSQTGLIGLLEALDYSPVRYGYHMETPDLDHIPDGPLPDGIEIRPVQPDQYRAIWEAHVEAFRDHWGATETAEEDFDKWANHPLNQPDLWVVAWEGDQVAGSILNYINHEYNTRFGRTLGFTENISVRRAWRRRGLARAMLAHSMALHKAQGMTQTGLGVDTENPSGALRLYESMGYRVLSQETVYRKSL